MPRLSGGRRTLAQGRRLRDGHEDRRPQQLFELAFRLDRAVEQVGHEGEGQPGQEAAYETSQEEEGAVWSDGLAGK